ncbi:hypothetical protein [Spirosoma aerophilum]
MSDIVRENPSIMTKEEAKQIILLLAFEKQSKEYSSVEMAYGRYIRMLIHMISSTSDLDVSAGLFAAVINQAQELNKTAEWIEQELFVEANASARANRLAYIHQLLTLSDGSDRHLDLYNARVSRFQN